MIEFTIPLNLPVRAVVATEPTARPPEWLTTEMERWSRRQQKSLPDSGSLTDSATAMATAELQARVDHEIDLLRSQQALFGNAVEELRRTKGQLEQQMVNLVHDFQQATIELAHAIAAKLTFDEIDQNRFPIENLVHEIVDRLETTTDAVIRLHPDDLAQIGELPVIEGSENEHSLRFVADSSLSRGDCKAKAGEISVIYDLRRQVEEIRRHLLSTVNGHAET